MKKNQWILLVVVVVVVGYAYFGIYKADQKEEAAKEVASQMVSLEKDQLSEISIQSEGSHLLLKKTPEGWVLESPLQDKTDDQFIDNFVATLMAEKSKSTLFEGQEIHWADFGLDKPKGSIKIKNNAGKELVFQVGSIQNFEGNSFVRVNDEKKVLIAGQEWNGRLDRKALDFREKRIIRDFPEGANALTFKGAISVDLKKENDQWKLAQQKDWSLDVAKVDELLRNLKNLKARDYLSEKDVPKSSPVLQIIVANKDKSWQGKVYKKDTYFVVTTGPWVMSIEDTHLKDLTNLDVTQFRNKKSLFQIASQDVKAIVTKVDSKQSEIRLEKDKWTSPEGEVDQSKVKEIFTQLGGLEVKEFLDQEKSLNKTTHKLSLLNSTGAPALDLAWGDVVKKKVEGKDKEFIKVKTNRNNGVVLVDKESLDKMDLGGFFSSSKK